MANDIVVVPSSGTPREHARGMFLCRDASGAPFPMEPRALGEIVTNPASWIRCLQMLAGGAPARMTVRAGDKVKTVTVVTMRRGGELAS